MCSHVVCTRYVCICNSNFAIFEISRRNYDSKVLAQLPQLRICATYRYGNFVTVEKLDDEYCNFITLIDVALITS